MNYEAWHLEADRLHKAVEYAACGPVRTRLMNLLHVHLEIKPTIDAEPTTPLPEITELSTVEKFGGWICWDGGDLHVNPEQRTEVRFRDGSTDKAKAISFVWSLSARRDDLADIIAYRIIKD